MIRMNGLFLGARKEPLVSGGGGHDRPLSLMDGLIMHTDDVLRRYFLFAHFFSICICAVYVNTCHIYFILDPSNHLLFHKWSYSFHHQTLKVGGKNVRDALMKYAEFCLQISQFVSVSFGEIYQLERIILRQLKYEL